MSPQKTLCSYLQGVFWGLIYFLEADSAVGGVKYILLLDIEVKDFSRQAVFADDFFNALVVFFGRCRHTWQ